MMPQSVERGDRGPRSEAGRLRDLEEAEERRRESRRLDHRFELTEAILMSIAAVLAAWAGFQAAKWSGVQANQYAAAAASRVDAARASTAAGQDYMVDVVSFTQWLRALGDEGLLDTPAGFDVLYLTDYDESEISGFLYSRFRPEFRPAVDAWLASEPRTAEGAFSPFAMTEYRLASAQEASAHEQQAEQHAAEARAANQRADNYVLMTIMFATVLFFAGISSKMDTARARSLLLATGVAVLVASAVVVASLPKVV